MRQIRLFDTTLRDGEQSPGCSMNPQEKLKLAALGSVTSEFTGMVRWLVEQGLGGRSWADAGFAT